MRSINNGIIPKLKMSNINGERYVDRIITRKFLSPNCFESVSINGLRLSTRDTGVIRTTHTTNKRITRNQDLTCDTPSSLYIFSHMMSD